MEIKNAQKLMHNYTFEQMLFILQNIVTILVKERSQCYILLNIGGCPPLLPFPSLPLVTNFASPMGIEIKTKQPSSILAKSSQVFTKFSGYLFYLKITFLTQKNLTYKKKKKKKKNFYTPPKKKKKKKKKKS